MSLQSTELLQVQTISDKGLKGYTSLVSFHMLKLWEQKRKHEFRNSFMMFKLLRVLEGIFLFLKGTVLWFGNFS